MKRKLLNINDKSAYLLCGKPDKIKSIQELLKQNPLSIKGEPIKQKLKEKYLGEMISSYGVSDSVKTTIDDRKGRIIASVFELSSIIEDFRMQTAGGLVSGLNIWLFGLLPSLMTNAEMWIQMPSDSLQSIEDIQHLLLRKLFSVPRTTPHVALRWDAGLISLEMQIAKQKLLFIYHLIKLEENSLANEMLRVQISQHLPGLVPECKELIKSLNLPDLFEKKVNGTLSKLAWKKLVTKAILADEEAKFKKAFSSKSKLRDGDMTLESFERKDYLTRMNLTNSRVKFSIRSKMLDIKFNYSAKYERELWLCDSCCSSIETQSHLLFCPAYSTLREGKDLSNDDHLIGYIQNVMQIRTKLKLRK